MRFIVVAKSFLLGMVEVLVMRKYLAEFTSLSIRTDPLPSLALGTNNSAISAIGNDYGFKQVFARELRELQNPRCFHRNLYKWQQSEYLGRSSSGERNVTSRQIAWTEQTGGKLHDQCECLALAETARIQESHIQ